MARKSNPNPASRNRTLIPTEAENSRLLARCIELKGAVSDISVIADRTLRGNTIELLPLLPESFADLIFVDPPYNLTKKFSTTVFKSTSDDEYEVWLDEWVSQLPRLMKSNGSIYVCADWRNSSSVYRVLNRYFIIQNRITFEREKGRGAKTNWKNSSEDIWFCTLSNDYTFNVESVKLRKKVIAPYTDDSGNPKGWSEFESDRFRLTYPSNLWTDITIPFWSMPENTLHPTQKPEKLVAKAILASSNPGDFIFDPFVGSGTTSVVAKKLGRKYLGIELEAEYCSLTEARLIQADIDSTIQGYHGGVFWERNSGPKMAPNSFKVKNELSLFDSEDQ